MLLRNLLLALGVLCLLAGLVLSLVWLRQPAPSPDAAAPAVQRMAVLAATHALPAGTLLRAEDFRWKELGEGLVRPGYLLRGQVAEGDFLGAITRRDFADGEPLIASELVKPSERQFLAAVLKPDTRAVSISTDAPQSASGLVLPGDRVDVILTQSFEGAADPERKSVGETVLRDVRVIALDQSLSTPSRGTPARGVLTTEARIPKTVTLEVSEQQAEILFVAMQLGRLQLAVRPLERADTPRPEERQPSRPTWASDVSPALKELTRRQVQPQPTASPVESAVRRPPVTP